MANVAFLRVCENGEPEVLLQRRSARVSSPNVWGLPGGALSSSEKVSDSGRLKGAIREVMEECGAGKPQGVPPSLKDESRSIHIRCGKGDMSSVFAHLVDDEWAQWRPRPQKKHAFEVDRTKGVGGYIWVKLSDVQDQQQVWDWVRRVLLKNEILLRAYVDGQLQRRATLPPTSSTASAPGGGGSIRSYLLGGGSLKKLAGDLTLRVTAHHQDPLVIVNYTVDSPKDSQIVRECRGLCLEVETWRVVARCFPRFFNYGELPSEQMHFDWSDFVAHSKEDGSLMVLYNYGGGWRVNTRHDFATLPVAKNFTSSFKVTSTDDAAPPSQGFTYKDLFERAAGMNLDEMGKFLDDRISYTFEVCSLYNKIVRNYAEPTLFLLAGFCNDTGEEVDDEVLDGIAPHLQSQRPQKQRFKNVEELKSYLQDNSNEDPSFEGFVVRDRIGMRMKVKSPSYLFLHRLRFSRLTEKNLTGSSLLPFVLAGEGSELFAVLGTYERDTSAVRQLFDRISEEVWGAFETSWATLLAATATAEDERVEVKEKDAVFATAASGCPFFSLLFIARRRALNEGRPVQRDDLKAIWRKSPAAMTKYILKPLGLCGDPGHLEAEKSKESGDDDTSLSLPLCQSEGHADRPDLAFLFDDPEWYRVPYEEANDGLAKTPPYKVASGGWIVTCFCGSPMELVTLATSAIDHKCLRAGCGYCGRQAVSSRGTRIVYRCTAQDCTLFHSAHQMGARGGDQVNTYKRGDPLGIPCSSMCLVFRHRTHEAFDMLWRDGGLGYTRGQAYILLASLMGRSKGSTHMAIFSISDCQLAIEQVLQYIKPTASVWDPCKEGAATVTGCSVDQRQVEKGAARKGKGERESSDVISH